MLLSCAHETTRKELSRFARLAEGARVRPCHLRFSGSFPKAELFGLTSQLRRASVSIPANIAEGFKKRGIKDKLRLLNVAQGSAEETHYYLILAQDLRYGDTSKLREALGQVIRMLEAYCKALGKNHPGA
jgi:four helix bundle protein